MIEQTEDVELITTELTTDEIAQFAELCKAEGKTISEKTQELIQFFLAGGDNHLARQSA